MPKKIKMKSDQKGSNNGVQVISFLKGITYNISTDISESLADVFVNDINCASYVKEKVQKEIKPDKVPGPDKEIGPENTADIKEIDTPEKKSNRTRPKRK